MFSAFTNFVNAFSVDTQVFLKNQVFYPGNAVEGVVRVNAGSPVDVYAVRVKIVGKQSVLTLSQFTTTECPMVPIRMVILSTELWNAVSTIGNQLFCSSSL